MIDTSLSAILELELPDIDDLLFTPDSAFSEDSNLSEESSNDILQQPPQRKLDEFPGDIRAFLRHPLTGEDQNASALLHEFNNLPEITKIGESSDFLNGMLRSEESGQTGEGWTAPDVDQFLNSDDKENKNSNIAKEERENSRSPIEISCQEIVIKSETDKQDIACSKNVIDDAETQMAVSNIEPPQMENGKDNDISKNNNDLGGSSPENGKKVTQILSEKIMAKRLARQNSPTLEKESNVLQQDTEYAEMSLYNSQKSNVIGKDGFLNQFNEMQQYQPTSTSDEYQIPPVNTYTTADNMLWTKNAATVSHHPPQPHFTTVGERNDFYYNNYPPGPPMTSYPNNSSQAHLMPLNVATHYQEGHMIGMPPKYAQGVPHNGDMYHGYNNGHHRHSVDYNSRSPDSGISEPTVSPPAHYNSDGFPYMNSATIAANEINVGKVMRRRRSTPVHQMCNQLPPKLHSSSYAGAAIPKLEYNTAGYIYTMETPISTSQRIDEDRLTYLNKGQFYTMTLKNIIPDRMLKNTAVKSVISLVFREDKTIEDELKAWEFWHGRQHSMKQRVIDLDTKNSAGILPNCVEEGALNSVAFRWNPKEAPAKISVAVHCLSTDFSNQKGVKGLPLHIQIDTFEDMRPGAFPVHRGYCQIKIFCDKGAERKTRDEEKRKDMKDKTEIDHCGGRRRQEEILHPPCERTEFYNMADIQNRPLLFNPSGDYDDLCSPTFNEMSLHMDSCANGVSGMGGSSVPEDGSRPMKRPRLDSFPRYTEPEKMIIYVRSSTEKVFTALLLRPPTLTGLAHAIQEKYGIAAETIKTIYKRSKRGILVKMDDNIIRHYSNESTFIIETEKIEKTNEHEITLSEIDVEQK